MPGSASAIRLPYVPQPRQKVLHQAVAREILYGGQAGGGKLGVSYCFDWIFQKYPNIQPLEALAKLSEVPEEIRAKDSKVLGWDGRWLSISEVTPGTRIMNPDGQFQEVLQVHYNGTLPCSRMHFEDGSSVECGNEHLWAFWEARCNSRKKSSNGENPVHPGLDPRTWNQNYITRARVRPTSWLASALSKNRRFLIPIGNRLQFTGLTRSKPDRAYLYGLLIGDGCIATPGTHGDIFLGTADPEIRDYALGLSELKPVCSVRPKDGFNSIKFSDKRSWLYGWAANSGLLGKYSWEKSFPLGYLAASVEFRIALAQGLFDSDGTAGDEKREVSYTSTSETLARQVADLVRTLGYMAKVSSRKPLCTNSPGGPKRCREAWTVFVQGNHLEDLFRLERKRERAVVLGEFNGGVSWPGKRIDRIEPIGDHYGICITVSNPNGLYVTDGYNTTHNSFGLRWDAIDFCLHLPGFFAGIFRRTNPELEENHISFIREELAALSQAFKTHIGKYNETRKRVEFVNGSHIRFKHLELEKDAHDIQGWELHGAYPDEAALMEPGLLAYIRSRIRLGRMRNLWESMALQDPAMLPYIARVPRFVLGSNPGGPSHHWLKENFIDPAPPETMFEITTGSGRKRTRIFIPASMRDNQYLDESYEDQFDDLPEWQRKQLRDGDWNTVPGAFFDCWSPQNVIRPFAVPDYWTRMWSCDWGFRQPFWIGEWVVSDGNPVKNMAGEWVTFPEECMILVREWYGREKGNKGIRMPAYEVGRALRDWAKADIKVADPSMWRSDSGPSPAERMAQAGIYWTQADNERVPGWQEMYARIKDGMLLSFDTCSHFLRIIPTLTHDEKNPEDVLKKGEDHPGDGTRYACMGRPYKKDRPKKKRSWQEEAVRVPTFNEIMNRRTPARGPEII